LDEAAQRRSLKFFNKPTGEKDRGALRGERFMSYQQARAACAGALAVSLRQATATSSRV